MMVDGATIRLLRRIKKAETLSKTKLEKDDWQKVRSLVLKALKEERK